LEARDEKIRELKLHVEAARESEAKQSAVVQSLRQKICEYEKEYGSLEGSPKPMRLSLGSEKK
jgi:hypothetical protein